MVLHVTRADSAKMELEWIFPSGGSDCAATGDEWKKSRNERNSGNCGHLLMCFAVTAAAYFQSFIFADLA